MRARIDRLQEPVKRTVQTAAVVGRAFGLGLLTRISERAAEILRDLETLKQAELIHETRVFPELAYCFKHTVIQDVAYESLLVQRRQALHGAIGEAIEELYADRILKLAAVGMTWQDLERDWQNVEQARALVETLADERRLTQVLYWQGRIPYVRGDYRAAIASAERSLVIADRLGDEALAAPSVNLLAASLGSCRTTYKPVGC